MTMQFWWMKFTPLIVHNTVNPFLQEHIHTRASATHSFRHTHFFRQTLKLQVFITPVTQSELCPVWPISQRPEQWVLRADKFKTKNPCLFCLSRKVIISDILLQKINGEIEHQLIFQTSLTCSVRYWQLNTELTTLGSVEQRLFHFSFWNIESIQLWT